MLANTLFSHHFVNHITSKLIWEGVFVSWTLNSMSKFVVAIENHSICIFFAFHDLSTRSPLSCSLHQFSMHLSGYRFALYLFNQ
jgi:hypothetical protein